MARPVMPADKTYHAAVGKVALAHGHLELVQRFLVRALEHVDMRVALDTRHAHQRAPEGLPRLGEV